MGFYQKKAFKCALCGCETDRARIITKGVNRLVFCLTCHIYLKTHYSELEIVRPTDETN